MQAITTIGLDIAKSVFQAWRRQLTRPASEGCAQSHSAFFSCAGRHQGDPTRHTSPGGISWRVERPRLDELKNKPNGC